MDEFWKKRNKPSAAQLTGALGESVKEYLKKTELPGEKAAVTLNSFYPADAGTLVRTLEEIGGPEKRWSWQGGQAEDKTGYGGPAAQQREQSGKGGWGQSGEPGFEQKVALVQQALQRDREAHRRQEGNHYTAGNTAGRGSGSFGGGNLSGESFPGAGAGGVPGGPAVGRSRPAFPTAVQGGAGPSLVGGDSLLDGRGGSLVSGENFLGGSPAGSTIGKGKGGRGGLFPDGERTSGAFSGGRASGGGRSGLFPDEERTSGAFSGSRAAGSFSGGASSGTSGGAGIGRNDGGPAAAQEERQQYEVRSPADFTAAVWQQLNELPQDFADTEEPWYDKFERGNVIGGVGSLLGTGLRAPQTLLLNATDALTAGLTGQQAQFQPDLTPDKYLRNMEAYGGQPGFASFLDELEASGLPGAVGANLLRLGYDWGTNPASLLDAAAWQKTQGLQQPGSGNYIDDLQNGGWWERGEDSFWTQQNEKPENFSFDTGETSQEAEKIPWNTWENYEKVVQDGQEYALVGGRPYSHHAVDRMQPSGRRYAAAGSIFQAGGVDGRSVAPQFIEEILQSVRPLYQPRTGNFEYKIGTIKIITNSKGSVVTIMIYQ